MINFNLGLTFESIKTIFRMLLDIFIMWMLLYYSIKIVRNNSKTIQIFKGIVFILIVNSLAKFLGLDTVVWLSDMFLNWGFLAIIIVFQPEVRSILEKLGKSNVFSRMSTLTGNEREKLVDEVVTATMLLSRNQTGALISLEQSYSLNDFIKTGTQINSNVTAELITSIFVTSTPLHDGAVIIQGDRIACASAYFPPTNLDLPSRYGARHRAAIGISEITDAITIVVSEETGGVSITDGGKIISVNRKELRDYLIRVICDEATEVKPVVKQHPLVIEKEVIPEVEAIVPAARVAQEYIVEEKQPEPIVEEKKEAIFDTAILSKLAIKRQTEENENNETVSVEEEMVEEIVEPKPAAVSTPKEKKPFSFFKRKHKEPKPVLTESEREAETNRSLDEEEANIKLPKRKEHGETQSVLYPTMSDVLSKASGEEVVQPIAPTPVVRDTPSYTSQNVRVMGLEETHEEKIPASGKDYRLERLEAIKQGNTIYKEKQNTMQHPVLDEKREEIVEEQIEQKKPVRTAFKADFSDKAETANLNFTGELKRPVNHEERFDTNQFRIIDDSFKDITDLIETDDNLENQFAILDALEPKKPSDISEIIDIKPANRAGGDQQ